MDGARAAWKRIARKAYLQDIFGLLLGTRSLAIQRRVMHRLKTEFGASDEGLHRAQNDLAYKDPRLVFMQDEASMLCRARVYAHV